MIGELQVPNHDKEGNEFTKRCTLVCKDEEFVLSIFGQDNKKPTESALYD